jgi:hypothetical protein
MVVWTSMKRRLRMTVKDLAINNKLKSCSTRRRQWQVELYKIVTTSKKLNLATFMWISWSKKQNLPLQKKSIYTRS